MSKKIYTCDACHYTFEAETGCDQCPDCGKRECGLPMSKNRRNIWSASSIQTTGIK